MIRNLLQNMVSGKTSTKTKPIEVGFWFGPYDKSYPCVNDFVDTSWSHVERIMVLMYVENAPITEQWMGWSECRFCGCHNGSRDRGDGVYVWPEGFGHYIRNHGVKPPVAFIEHVKKQMGMT